jgi:hypothetical protein
MARYADEGAVAQSAQSYYHLPAPAGLPWSGEIVDLIDALAADRLPDHLTAPKRAERAEQRQREAERERFASRSPTASRAAARSTPTSAPSCARTSSKPTTTGRPSAARSPNSSTSSTASPPTPQSPRRWPSHSRSSRTEPAGAAAPGRPPGVTAVGIRPDHNAPTSERRFHPRAAVSALSAGARPLRPCAAPWGRRPHPCGCASGRQAGARSLGGVEDRSARSFVLDASSPARPGVRT